MNYKEVYSRFDVGLFKSLKPALVSLEIERFDGCHRGDEVHLLIGIGPIKQKWISLITDDYQKEDECAFIDEGKLLPPPLKKWKHIHHVVNTGKNSCEIQDDIFYTTGNKVLDRLIYPIMYAQFAMRSPVYKRYFQ